MTSSKPAMSKYAICLVVLLLIAILSGCTSMQALRDINENPENSVRGDPENPIKVREFLLDVLASPEGREVRSFHRRAYSTDNKKNLFMVHSFYVFFKDGEVEHTVVFTATPKGSERDGNWMLDAQSDVDSYNLYMESDNPWEVEEYIHPYSGPGLDLQLTVRSILHRLHKEYTFFGPASVRNLPWYHLLWVSLAPPPILSIASILLLSIHTDNCTSAIVETMVWTDKQQTGSMGNTTHLD